MKKTKILTLAGAFLTLSFVACNNDGDNTASADTTSTMGNEPDGSTTSASSTGRYAAMADSFRINSEAGHYIDAKTGKKIRIRVDSASGARINEETGEPVSYYVDNRTWWVYGSDNWDTVGSARMEHNQVTFQDQDQWVTFDKKWSAKEGKMKTDDVKIKTEKDGDFKIKTEDGKIKSDEDGVKVKKD